MPVLFRTTCTVVALWAATSSSVATAGGSNYTVQPGSNPGFAGSVREWSVPTPAFARDPAVTPDGTIYITVMHAEKIARFDPTSEKFQRVEPARRRPPHGLLVDGQGLVWYTGNGNGTIGRLDPSTGKVTEFKTLGR
jgi:virginiamycin B lyase